ncbi:MAG: phosphate signaling complex protein PhoU [Opitutae bacterium]|nr:phosphate signaling complex protein PhoU [Opitutae bacterium]MBC9889571.1 phosphate signaling complex protein PhoU [Opitutae bacterium]
MKRFFHSELEDFHSNLIMMGQKAIEVTRKACKAILELDPQLAREVLQEDDVIDNLEITIDTKAIRYISLRAPVANDLRLLMVGTKVTHNLERIGDEACGIAKRVIRISRVAAPKLDQEFPDMITLTIGMLNDAIQSFLEGDVDLAEELIRRDRLVDEFNYNIFHNLTQRIMRDPETALESLESLFISKSLERIADHSCNLAEQVVSLFRGEDIRHSPEIKALKTKDRII